ncbi:MAG: SUMF1/EgtB/PvdO family nonheme iron enzyme [Alkalispirochaeta sp.]
MAARWKDIQSEDEISELSVTLKHRLGISPYVYVPAMWGGALLLVLLAVLVLPGIRKPGEQVTITSVPAGAEITVDGKHRGTTPATVFLSQGSREIRITAGTAEERINAGIGRRIVGSMLFPKRRSYTVVLGEPDVVTTIDSGITEFAQWSLMGEPSSQFQHAPVAHDTARRLWASKAVRSAPPGEQDELNRFRRDLLAHAGRWQVRDLSAAMIRASAPGSLPTPGSIGELVRIMIQIDNNSPLFAHLVWDVAPADEVFRAPLTDSVWAETRLEALSTALLAGSLAPDERPMPSPQVIEARGLRFARVPAGSYILGYPLRDEGDQGAPVDFDQAFWIQDRELTRSDFVRFVREEPRWAPENRDELMEQRLVQPEYLADWPDDWESAFVTGAAGTEPLRYVSRHAIDAFVSWLNADGPGNIPGVDSGRFALPSAAQWEYAAFLNGLGDESVVAGGGTPQSVGTRTAGALDIYDLEGNLWEWTSEWYANHYRVIAPTSGDQRIVVGGSFATGETGHNLVGAQPPEWTTPFLGGRLVIVAGDSEMENNGR